MGRVCGSFSATCHPAARGRKRRFLATPPCPAGQRALPVCGFDVVCSAGKGASKWRAGSWLVHGKKYFAGRSAHRETFPARRGTWERASPRKGRSFFPHTVSSTPSQRAFPRKKRRYAPSHRRNAPLPPKNLPHLYLSIRSKRGPLQAAPHLSRFAANIQRTPKPSFPRFKSLQQSARHPPSVLRLAVCPIGMIAPLPSISSQLPADR